MIQGKTVRFVAALVAVFLGIALLYPISIVVMRGFVIDGQFSLANVEAMINDPAITSMLGNTLLVTFGGAALGMAIGIPLAITTTLLPAGRRERRLLQLAPIVPLTIPALVGAIGWLFLLSPRAGWLNVAFRNLTGDTSGEGPLSVHSTVIVIFVLALYVVPYVYTIMAASLSRLGTELIESYQVCGCGVSKAMFKVITGPLKPALFAALSLAIVHSFSQFSVPLILRMDVLTTYLHRQVRFLGNYGGAAVAAIPLFLIGLLLTLWQSRLGKQSDRYATVSGRGTGVRIISFGRFKDRMLKASAYAYLIVAGVLPMSAILVVSLISYWRPDITLSDLGFGNYTNVWQTSLVQTGARNSLILALSCSLAACLLVVTVVVLAQRVGGLAARSSYFFANLPLGLPLVLMGLAFLIAFISPPFVLYGTIWILVLAYVVAFLPIGIRNIGPVYQQIGGDLEEAAMVSGATWLGALRKITAPLIMPGIGATAALLFVLIFREFPMAAFISTPRVNVLSMALLDYNENARWTHVAVLAVFIAAVSIVGVLVANAIVARFSLAKAPTADESTDS